MIHCRHMKDIVHLTEQHKLRVHTKLDSKLAIIPKRISRYYCEQLNEDINSMVHCRQKASKILGWVKIIKTCYRIYPVSK